MVYLFPSVMDRFTFHEHDASLTWVAAVSKWTAPIPRRQERGEDSETAQDHVQARAELEGAKV